MGSPFKYINHVAQTPILTPLESALAESDPKIGIDLSDIAFTWAFTTQTAESALVAVRDGLYEEGVQAHIGEEFPAEIAGAEVGSFHLRCPAPLAAHQGRAKGDLHPELPAVAPGGFGEFFESFQSSRKMVDGFLGG